MLFRHHLAELQSLQIPKNKPSHHLLNVAGRLYLCLCHLCLRRRRNCQGRWRNRCHRCYWSTGRREGHGIPWSRMPVLWPGNPPSSCFERFGGGFTPSIQNPLNMIIWARNHWYFGTPVSVWTIMNIEQLSKWHFWEKQEMGLFLRADQTSPNQWITRYKWSFT